jgi:hypothetical protein
MARKLIVEVAADISQYVKSLKQGEHATGTFAKEVTVDARTVAKAQVDAAIKSTEALRKQAGAYRELAAVAAKGSKEQVAAARLATDAEQKLARSIATTTKEAKEFSRSGRGVDRFGRGALAGSGLLGGAGRAAGFASTSFLGGLGLTAGALAATKASVSAASDLNEQLSKSRVVFGQAGRSVEAWSKTTTEAFGTSQREAIATASSFGALFRPIGLTGQEAAKQAEGLTKLGADLASFYNTDVASALDAIRSGIVGESEPLRNYGVQLSETRVQQEALKETGKEHVSQLTNQEKTLARIKIIFQDTKKAQGDYARTSGGLANQTRTLKANIDDLSASFGKLLIPVLTDATGKLNEFFKAAKGDPGGGGGGSGDFARGVGTLADAFKKLGPAVGPATRYTESLFTRLPVIAQGIGAVRLLGTVTKRFSGDAKDAALQTKLFRSELDRLIPAAAKAKKPLVDLRTAGGIVITDFRTPEEVAVQRSVWFDDAISRMLDRSQDIPTLKGQIAKLREIAALIQKRIAATNDVTRTLKLGDDLVSVQRQIRADQATIAANAVQAAEDAKQKRQQAVQSMLDALSFGVDKAAVTATLQDDLAALERLRDGVRKALRVQGDTLDLQRQLLDVNQRIAAVVQQQAERRAAAAAARQFRALGLGPGGEDLIPGIGNLRKRLQSIRKSISGTSLDTHAIQQTIRHIGQVLSGAFGAVGDQVRSKIDEIFKSWADELKSGRDTLATKFRPVDANKFIANLGLGLTPEQVKRLRAGIVTLGPGATGPTHHTGAFAAAGSTTIHIEHFHSSASNAKQLEEALAKRARARPHTRRGR